MWNRTRTGLLLTAIGLLISWIPIVAVIGVPFLSLGSTFLFLGARAAGRRHEVSVALSFLVLTIGGVIIGILVFAFLFQAYDAAFRGLPLRVLREPASLMLWVTLPASFALAGGFALQIVALLPHRQRTYLYGLSALLALTAIAATWLAEPEIGVLNVAPIRAGAVVEFLIRVSLYRMLEAPAYVGLAILYFEAYTEAGYRPRESALASVASLHR